MHGRETGGYAFQRAGAYGEEDWCYEYVRGYGDGYGCGVGQRVILDALCITV